MENNKACEGGTGNVENSQIKTEKDVPDEYELKMKHKCTYLPWNQDMDEKMKGILESFFSLILRFPRTDINAEEVNCTSPPGSVFPSKQFLFVWENLTEKRYKKSSLI